MSFFNTRIIFVGVTMFYMVFAEHLNVKTDSHVKSLFIKMLRNIIEANESRMTALKKITKLEEYVTPPTRMSADDEDADDSLERLNSVIALLNPNVKTSRTHKSDDQRKPANKIIFLFADDQNQSRIKLNNKNSHRNLNNIEDSSIENDQENKIEFTDDEKINVEVESKEVGISVEKGLGIPEEDLRRSWIRSCSKKAAKVCRKACIRAYKSFCRTYSCSSRAKRRFRTECKYSCRSKFNYNYYSDFE